MTQKVKRFLIWAIIGAVLLAVAAVGVWGFWVPYSRAVSRFSENKTVIMQLQPDGSVALLWPEGIDADQYLVEVEDPASGKVEFSEYVAGEPTVTLPALAESERTIRIYTAREYRIPFASRPCLRLGEQPITLTDTFRKPVITEIIGTPLPETDQLEVELKLAEPCSIRLYKLEAGERSEPIDTFRQQELTLSFGGGQRWPIPVHGEVYTFAFDAYKEGEGYVYYGPLSQTIELTRGQLMGTELTLQSKYNGDNTFTLSWNETRGDYYELQYRPTTYDSWTTLKKVAARESRSYITQPMESFTTGQYRVTAKYNDGKQAARNDTELVEMGTAVAYSTIWPIKDLTVYTDTSKIKSIGTAKRGTAFCVLREEDGMFRIRLGNKYGYIDSNYCLINLPECMGDLCSYDITNSYASVFKIHEYPIPELTDVVIPGYEKVMMGDLEDENRQYLVPLLYPVVQKLGVAARAAQEAGYKLRIVDSFRPKKATLYMYDTALEYAENTIVPAELGGTKTFYAYMSDDGRFPMSYFVSKGPSNHNRGFALDLTLENADGEVSMQTAMHDLSWFSEPKLNNAAAKKLAQFMKSAGFQPNVSEWWHFNDMQTRDAFNPPALDEGVTPECWMANENGWRYRQADGAYLVNCSETIGGINYRFDEKGYVIPD